MLFFALVISLVLCCWQVESATNTAFQTGQCLTLPSDVNYMRINPCAGVVNYQYFSFGSLTPKALETKARTALSSVLIPQLGQATISNLVRLTCANIYLKCYKDVVPSDPSTYNYLLYQQAASINYGVPFYRPCRSTCAPFTVQSLPNGLLQASGSLPSCTTTFDYTFTSSIAANPISTYDSNTTNAAIGQCFIPASRTFAAATETYVNNGGPCDGFVGAKFITPPGSNVNSSYAALQSTGVPQSLLSAAVSKSIPTFPVFVPSECRKAFKQYACYSAFLNPTPVTVSQAVSQSGINPSSLPGSFSALGPYTLYLPQYPAYDECTHFTKVCASLLNTAGRKVNCSAKASTSPVGARSFPENKQIVASVTLTSPLPTLKISTNPNNNTFYNATADSTSYTESCPPGFVIPDDPDNPDVQWITGTSCAIPCRAPLWTEDEWDYYINTANRIPIAGTIFGIITLLYIIYTKSWEENYLMIVYTIVALVASSQSWNFVSRESFDERMCIDNAVNFMQKYRHGPCITQGVILHYCFMSCSAVLLCMALERFLVHHKLTDLTRHPVYLLAQVLVIFFYPIIPVVIVAASNGYGFAKSQGVCFILSSTFTTPGLDTGLGGVTVLVVYGLTYIVMILSALYIWRAWVPLCPTKETSGKWKPPHHGLTCMDMIKGIDHYFALILLSVFVFVPYFAFWGQIQLYQEDYRHDYMDWVKCVFSNWDGSTTASYVDVCGEHVDSRPSNASNPFLDFALTANMIVMGPIFIIVHAVHTYLNEPEERYNPLPSTSRKFPGGSAKEEPGIEISGKSEGITELQVVGKNEELQA